LIALHGFAGKHNANTGGTKGDCADYYKQYDANGQQLQQH
jgi:hypothetical protein